jgi:diguanylate cyclase (GGDEF)-like protein
MQSAGTSIVWVDNRTLVCCHLLITSVYAVTFLGLKRIHPNLRGAGSVALGFACAFVGAALMAAQDFIPQIFSITLAHLVLLVAGLLFYRGALRFFRSERSMRVMWTVIGVAAVGMVIFSVGFDAILARVFIRSSVVTYTRAVAAIEVLRHANGRPFVKTFGYWLSLFAVLGLVHIVLVAVYGVPPNLAQNDLVQTSTLALGFVFTCMLGVFFLLTFCGELVAIVQVQTQRDPLAGCLNRLGIEESLSSELANFAATGRRLCVALIDVDTFKAINDTRGHAAGDDVLRNVVGAITTRLRLRDHLGRFGGDEFLLVLPDTAQENAALVAERVHRSLEEFWKVRREPPVTLSIGIAEAAPGEPVADLLERADQALYEAKRSGRNCTRVAPSTSASWIATGERVPRDLPISELVALNHQADPQMRHSATT